ncbi:ABC transporter permease [Brevibacillus sp. NRS-1366]|uniref:ABC transporter permease n=1 Tax=Brevibacillus sp. NRS-1366 TaxID=3233899 RepID=UPI003D22F58A
MLTAKKASWGALSGGVSFPYLLTRIPGVHWILVIVPLGYLLFLMIYSLFGLFKLSIYDENGFTFQYFHYIFSHSIYLHVMWLTIKISCFVTIVSLLLAYPLAKLLVQLKDGIWKKLVFGLILVPFWISLLVRTFAWTIILQDQGVINKLLIGAGIIEKPLSLLYNTPGVVIGMTHILIPYMVVSLYSVMEGIDQRLIQAAAGMGARPWQAFFHVFLPLSLPGILSGSLIVFILSLGYFVTPALLGGPENMMISMLIENNIVKTLNWHLAAAIAVLLFIVTMLLLAFSYLLVQNHSAVKEMS